MPNNKFDVEVRYKRDPVGEARLEDAMADAVLLTLRDISVRAKELAPKLTGTLQRSIDFEENAEGTGGIIFTQAGYGGYQEIGTRFMAGKFYMTGALAEKSGNVHDHARRLLGR